MATARRSPGTRKIGRPAQVDRAVILRAAGQLGFDSLTMTSLGKHLGVSHSTLYGHFASRDEIVLASIEDIFGGVQWPRFDGDWRPFLRATILQFWDVLNDHRGLAFELDSTRISLPRGYAEFVGNLRGGLLDAEFLPLDAILTAEICAEQALAFHKFTRDAQGRSLTVGEYRANLKDKPLDSLRGIDDRGRQGIAEMVQIDPREWFSLKLDVVLDGIESLRQRHSGPSSDT
ncbi:TetR/AcrR family transcriptional regulator [Williamsia sp. 1135]|uniref:TetR/AcrR family transcriptional regulator n=1 Tax=Williamsia sp. 1135 TaxID=1889262 RepID=UPI000A100612|nr:TetR/AcrR family transcriptional regulator [Williamsia sp. 1135]ORM32172.1 hypothetical protein BFL43_16480 [Williamsia sp. 1135]